MGKKRPRGTGTIRQRKDGKWEGRYVIGYNEKGNAKTKSVYADTREECEEKLDALVAQFSPQRPSNVKADMLFTAWIQYWYEQYCKMNIAERTQETYEMLIYRHINPQLEGVKLNQLTQNDLQQMYARLKQSGRIRRVEQHGAGLSNSMVRGCHLKCHAALEKAKELGLIYNNPAKGCKLPPKKAREMQVLDREELQRLLIQAREDGCYEMLLLELATGLRRGELVALQWSDIDFKARTVSVTKQAAANNGGLTISAPKTKASIRTLVLPPSVLAVLKEYKAKSNSKWLFPSPVIEGAPINPSWARRQLGLVLERAGCKHIRFHDLRHTFATNALEYGMDIKTLSAVLGHQSAATTIDVYAHITKEMQKKAAISIDRGIAKNEIPPEVAQEQKPRQMTEFQPYTGKKRKPGTGGVYQIGPDTWEGRCSLIWPDGKRHSRFVYAHTREETEEKLKAVIADLRIEREEARHLYKQKNP